ncbi:MAG: SDR family oxidoreductase [Propionibacteriaceae bacterium]|jgi:3-oxoacyl-[acyl-carrier protein] reductase|nr:SDR family oxidoreductase [Propionibacteriaceae bacterium]
MKRRSDGTVNVIAPGYVAGTEFFPGGVAAGRHEALVAQTMTGRAGTAQDVSATVLWLCGPGARHITGQVIHVNGGAYVGL